MIFVVSTAVAEITSKGLGDSSGEVTGCNIKERDFPYSRGITESFLEELMLGLCVEE